tara:strand:+ start:426 stop:545 length:120 start_codon:yes stop_codon:yes gene_type:complete
MAALGFRELQMPKIGQGDVVTETGSVSSVWIVSLKSSNL